MDTYGDPGDRAPNLIFREHSLLPAKNSLFPEIFSLLICVGNFTRSRCGTAVSRNEIRFRGTKIAKFPVNFPVSRELPTGDRFVSDCAHHQAFRALSLKQKRNGLTGLQSGLQFLFTDRVARIGDEQGFVRVVSGRRTWPRARSI
jgi:hypothetical protein